MMRFLYTLSVRFYTLAIKLASPFNVKARQWITGRKNLFEELKTYNLKNKQVIWVHTASLGEFEQGRPIIEKLKIDFPDHNILLTFFSPSGYEIRKGYQQADFVSYLPADTISNAKKFIKLVNPELAIFIKYEFWYNYLYELNRNKIPTIFASVIFRSSQHFFKPWGIWFARQLNKITFLYVQNEESLDLLDSININHADLGGDTRFDRVIQLPGEDCEFPEIEKFKGSYKLIVGGSTWQPDEAILLKALEDSSLNFKLIIAPHLISNEHISDIISVFSKYNPVKFTECSQHDLSNSKVMIVDKIGFLSLLYRFANIAYIGGGFGVGIHNLLEASTYGVPVIFGPNHKKFREAIELQKIKGGFAINNEKETIQCISELLSDKELYHLSSRSSKEYVKKNSGATQKVINKVKEYIVAG